MPSISHNQKNPILIVQGAQWGSEAKGAIAAHLCQTRAVDYAVRTGAINAGHTVYYSTPTVVHQGSHVPKVLHDVNPPAPYKMQQLPTGWVNPSTKLVLGAGALIHPPTLIREISLIARATNSTWEEVADRIYIDPRAGLHFDSHTDRSTLSGRHHRIGATGKGCSEALVDRIKMRGRDGYGTWADLLNGQVDPANWKGGGPGESLDPSYLYLAKRTLHTDTLLNHELDKGARILLEGTQGTHLDLLFGPYPYTTHKPCCAGQWMVEAGLAPSLASHVVLVARTYPIRVAGNSGPMRDEISWAPFARELNEYLDRLGLPYRVHPDAIDDFEDALARVPQLTSWKANGLMPGTTDNSETYWALNQHQWSASQRLQFSVAISELNRVALSMLDEPTRAELSKLFELTTVTLKMRRIARFNRAAFATACMMNRPAEVALTFFNYLHPEVWDGNLSRNATGDTGWMSTINKWSRMVQYESGGAPLSMFSTGPLPDHIHNTDLVVGVR